MGEFEVSWLPEGTDIRSGERDHKTASASWLWSLGATVSGVLLRPILLSQRLQLSCTELASNSPPVPVEELCDFGL